MSQDFSYEWNSHMVCENSSNHWIIPGIIDVYNSNITVKLSLDIYDRVSDGI